MDIYPTLVSNREPPVPVQPGERAFHHPAMPTQSLAGPDATSSNANHDVSVVQEPSAAGDVIRLVGMELGGTPAALTARRSDWRHGIDHGFKDDAVVPVRPGQETSQGNALPIDNHVPFDAWSGAIRGIRAGRVAPLYLGEVVIATIRARQIPAPAVP